MNAENPDPIDRLIDRCAGRRIALRELYELTSSKLWLAVSVVNNRSWPKMCCRKLLESGEWGDKPQADTHGWLV